MRSRWYVAACSDCDFRAESLICMRRIAASNAHIKETGHRVQYSEERRP